jgi:hypothetical protein
MIVLRCEVERVKTVGVTGKYGNKGRGVFVDKRDASRRGQTKSVCSRLPPRSKSHLHLRIAMEVRTTTSQAWNNKRYISITQLTGERERLSNDSKTVTAHHISVTLQIGGMLGLIWATIFKAASGQLLLLVRDDMNVAT